MHSSETAAIRHSYIGMQKGRIGAVQKKLFWTLVTVLSLVADFALPLVWGLVATIPIVLLCWWIVYRSDWLDL